MIGLNENFQEDPSTGASDADLHALIEMIFARDSFLVDKLGLEPRPQQSAMAERIADNLLADSPLLVEAGTGVGKSLAYLLPAVLHAQIQNRTAIVSSHTIALQEQLEKKDIPLCRKILENDPKLAPFAQFKHTVLVGRQNYICGARLSQAIETKTELFPSDEQKELERIAEWYRETKDGVLQELNPPPMPEVWEWVSADGAACNKRNCSKETCFYRRARAAIGEANLVIVNHSLLFALLASGHFPGNKTPGILFPLDFLVLDEAHTLPSIATDHFGLYLSEYGLRRQLLRLHNPKKKKAKGLLSKYGNPLLAEETKALLQHATHFFASLRTSFLMEKDTFRPAEPGWTENSLDMPLKSLIGGIRKTENRIPEGPGRDELEGLRKTLQSYVEGLNNCIHLSDTDSVYWIERAGRSQPVVRMRSAPLDLAPILRERLFARETGIILTSATLAEGPDMQSFQNKIGAEEAEVRIEQSPFDFPMQMQICIAKDAPAPNVRNQQLDLDYLADQIQFCAQRIKGGTLVLFTSYRDMYRVEKHLREKLRSANRTLLVQGQDGSRSQLVQQLKAIGNAILFGTDSFWTGIDVPGSALEQVIITRLPFDNPDHPVAEARAELCRERGGNPFAEITLPAALVKFRQGIGRLIRNQTDEGIVTILDARIVHKPYGSLFLDSLPHNQVIWFTRQNRETAFPLGD